MQLGVMFWAGRDPSLTLSELTSLGFQAGQLGIPGNLNLSSAAEWKQAARAAGFTIHTVIAAYEGESYEDIPAVEETVGFVPPATRHTREARTLAISDFAAELGVPGIGTHIGFLPDDTRPNYVAVRDTVRRVCDHAAKNNQTFALETGQESAEALLDFLRQVDRPNLGINFDPANMILYGTGDPMDALDVLGKHIITVHAKDGDWPPADVQGALGMERPLGQGAVGMERFIAKLKAIGYDGLVAIEREAKNPAQRLSDIEQGAKLLRSLL